MSEEFYNIGIRPDAGEMFPAGIGYVIIPSDVGRTEYVKECYKTSTVSIYSEFNGVSNRVPVDSFTLNFIEFPQDVNQFGSAVCFIVEPVHKKPIIVSKYFKADELSDLKENQFKFKREVGGNAVEISGSPDGKYLVLNVNSSDKGGEVQVNVKSKDESGTVSINVEGDCNITALNRTKIKQFDSLQLITQNRHDETELTFEEHTPQGRHIMSAEEKLDTESFKINDGEEPFVLGQKLKTFLDDFIDELSKITVTTSLGQMPILNKAQVTAFKNKTEPLLSEVAFLDK